MREYVESQIMAKRAKVHDLDRQKLMAEAELRAFEEMLTHMEASGAPMKANGSPPKTDRSASSVPAGMTPQWRQILCGLEKLGRTFTAADILAVGESVGHPTKIINVRSQIYQWERKHIISRVRKGKYRIAPKGTEIVQKGEDSDAQTSESSL